MCRQALNSSSRGALALAFVGALAFTAPSLRTAPRGMAVGEAPEWAKRSSQVLFVFGLPIV